MDEKSCTNQRVKGRLGLPLTQIPLDRCCMEIIKNATKIDNTMIHVPQIHESIYQFLHSMGLIFSGPIVETASRPIRFAGRECSREKTEWMHCKYLEKGILITIGSFRPTIPQKITRFFPYSNTPPSREQYTKYQKEQAKQRFDHENNRILNARATALAIYTKAATEGVNNHPYFMKKRLNEPYDIHATNYLVRNQWVSSLVVPIKNFSNILQGIQLIFAEKIDFGNRKPRDKHIVGTLKGNFFLLGNLANQKKYIVCEGVATGYALFQSSLYTTLCCLSCKNYYPVVERLVQLYPHATILIACDNDLETRGNPGIQEAQKIQRVFPNVKIAIPPSLDGKSVDFNDLYCRGIP
jgi:hypothetical protein